MKGVGNSTSVAFVGTFQMISSDRVSMDVAGKRLTGIVGPSSKERLDHIDGNTGCGSIQFVVGGDAQFVEISNLTLSGKRELRKID